MRLNRHTQTVTGLAQITDERLVSSSMDGTVSRADAHTATPVVTAQSKTMLTCTQMLGCTTWH